MLQILMYHDVGTGKFANSKEMLVSHLKYIKENCDVVLPGDPIGEFSVCLTFDDAFYSFYHTVFPLLREFGLRAMVGVPVKYILEDTERGFDERLNISYYDAFVGENYLKAPFCTWRELRKMVESGYVEVASHSYSHLDLTKEGGDLEREIVFSKKRLEELGQYVSTFIYPFGRVNEAVLKFVERHYSFSMRIGGAMNNGWEKLLCRVSGDNLSSPAGLFGGLDLGKSYLKYLINRCR